MDNHNIATKPEFDTVDIKAKVLSKTEEKQLIIVRGESCMKADCVIADHSGQVRLELWQDAVDQINRGKSYQFTNLKVKMFDDTKYVNTTRYTKITNIDDIKLLDIDNLSVPDIQENLIKGRIIGLIIIRKDCCILCNANIQKKSTELMTTWGNCKNSILTEIIGQVKVGLRTSHSRRQATLKLYSLQ